MGRLHLFEFTDLSWYPQTFRRLQTDYLQFVGTRGTAYKNLVPLLTKALTQTGTDEIVDLCSGGTGLWLRLQDEFRQMKRPLHIQLTDKYPQPEAIRKWSDSAREGIEYVNQPVDAANVPPDLKGMRTIFEGFHHFKPKEAEMILRDAAESREAIGIFEICLRPQLAVPLLLLAPLTTLISYLVLTPFIQPRSWSRFLWTYLIPLVPLATCWDGVISMLRVYSQQELKELTERIDCQEYRWEIGQASTGTPVFDYRYLIGYPTTAS